MTDLAKLLLPILICLQAHIIALGASKPELFDSTSEHYLFRKPDFNERLKHRPKIFSAAEINKLLIPQIINIDEFNSLLASFDDQDKHVEIMKSSAYGNFISSIQSINIILKNKSLRELSGQLSFLNDQKKIESDFIVEFSKKCLESHRNLEFFIPRYLDTQSLTNHTSALATYLIESVIWEVINEETTRTVQQIVKGKITPYIWEELKKDVLKQICYHVKNQRINGITNPQVISTDLIVGDYKIIHINELYKGHEQRMQNILEESSSHYALKNLYPTIFNRIDEANRLNFDKFFQTSWQLIPIGIRQDLKHKIVDLFILSDMQRQLDFDQFQISWEAYHGKLSGNTQVLIDYTHLAFVWVGLIVYRSKQFSQLREDFVKTIEQQLSNEEIDEIFIDDLDKIPKESKSFAFANLLSAMRRLYEPSS